MNIDTKERGETTMLKIVNKKKFIRGISIIVIGIAIIIFSIVMIIKGIIYLLTKKIETEQEQLTTSTIENSVETFAETTPDVTYANQEILNEWNLKLVNKDNAVDKSYVPELEEIDDGIMFDKRAINYLNNMINAMYKDGIKNVWVASAYRSYEKQEELFNNKVKYYKEKGNNQEEAEKLAQTIVQRPEMSEHNLALAVDFNKVNNEFEDTKAFEWLKENGQDYGFILRYPKDKQEITGITYESWHWRYVGEEHAKIMNEKGYCLEEYIDYLKGVNQV